MDLPGMLNRVSDKIKSVFSRDNSFFYGGNERHKNTSSQAYDQQAASQNGMYENARQQAPYPQQAPYEQQPVAQSYPQFYNQNGAGQGYQQATPQNYAAPAPQAYAQMPGQQAWQQTGYSAQPMDPAYSTPYQQPAPQAFSSPQEAQLNQQADSAGRNRRAAVHNPQPEGNLLQFPGAAEAEPEIRQMDAYVVNVTSITGCRQAMTCLRKGQCTLVVMDQLIDKAEVRRYVDMLNGACFALGGTMTRLSLKVGFYILAPSGMMVYTDPLTANANAQQAQPQAAQAKPVYQAAPAQRSFAYPPPQQIVQGQPEHQQQSYQMPSYNGQQIPYPPATGAPVYGAEPQGYPMEGYAQERYAQ